MKKLISLLLVMIYFCCSAQAQQVVFDPIALSTMIKNHIVENNNLKVIKEKETAIAGFQATIAQKTEVIRSIHMKIYDAQRKVGTIIRQIKDVKYAIDILTDIRRYQTEMIQLASGNPELTVIAFKTQAELISRSADLIQYIYTIAFVGGDANLMKNKDRMDVIKHVVAELRMIRGLAYTVVRKMKLAKNVGLLNALDPFGFNRPNSINQFSQQMQRDIQLIFNR